MAPREKSNHPIPDLGQALIETHCHLDYLKQAEIGDIVRRANEVGIERIVTISVDPDNLDRVRDVAAAHECVYTTQGIHPHEAQRFDEGVAARIVDGLDDDKVLAVGEIGLDYYYDNSPREAQRDAFARQLAIATEADLPIVVHTREAEEDTRSILAEYAPDLRRKGVIHSFTSSVALAEACLELGFCLGFNGIVTFKAADNVREVLAAVPVERLLLETDAPFLTPVPYRGKENAPFYLPFVAEKVAEVKDIDLDQLLPRVRATSLALFWNEAVEDAA